jgi:hypothetical protein
MMIDLGKAEVFIRKGLDLIERGIWSDIPGAYLLEQRFQSICVHVTSLSLELAFDSSPPPSAALAVGEAKH